MAGSSSARSHACRRNRSKIWIVASAGAPCFCSRTRGAIESLTALPLRRLLVAPFTRGDAVKQFSRLPVNLAVTVHRVSFAASRPCRSCTLSSTSAIHACACAILRQCPEREFTVNPARPDRSIRSSARCATPTLMHQPHARHEQRHEPSNKSSRHKIRPLKPTQRRACRTQTPHATRPTAQPTSESSRAAWRRRCRSSATTLLVFLLRQQRAVAPPLDAGIREHPRRVAVAVVSEQPVTEARLQVQALGVNTRAFFGETSALMPSRSRSDGRFPAANCSMTTACTWNRSCSETM